MFEVEPSASGLPFKTKRTLQALLKTREQLLSSNNKNKTRSTINLPPNYDSIQRNHQEQLCGLLEPETSTISQNPDPENDGDPNQDFSYSQKLFHIADGNLYSIFSPLQGRSYGMKPSFLRKQKCTVQECRGKGRKVIRKGLKFHNFLPSEVVTSEKDNNNYREDEWQVHSECKLREEHGTKQIMVSNWFQNVKQSNDIPANSEVSATNPQTGPNVEHSMDIKSYPVIEQRRTSRRQKRVSESKTSNLEKTAKLTKDSCNSFTSSTFANEICQQDEHSSSDNNESVNNRLLWKHQKSGSFLNNLLFSIDKTNALSKFSISKSTDYNELNSINDMNSCLKSRRKPNQTRRVVPYTKYLSILEENESSPLDLSCNTRPNNISPKAESTDDIAMIHHKNNSNLSLKQASFVDTTSQITQRGSKQRNHVESVPYFANERNTIHEPSSSSYQPVPSYVYPMSTSANNVAPKNNLPPKLILLNPMKNGQEQVFHNRLHVPTGRNASTIGNDSNPPPPYHNSNHINPEIKNNAFTKPKKKSQRAVIKQKLEDTFRQNGFLVKTKQVSDGEATFCKFRQLRKYTRYYLKSWQHHLPDEVHKMWKGFLPPKTVLPPVSEAHSQINDPPPLLKLFD